MTYRERRERRAERLREWAAKREVRAAETFASHEVYRGDVAFNTQPGHIPQRARVIAQTERAVQSLRKADSMVSRADNIEAQLAGAIYSDDPNAVPALEERLARLEAERDRIKAYNASCRKGSPDLSLLDERQQRDLASALRFSADFMGRRGGQFPPYHLANLNGNIKRNRDRLERLRAK